MQGEFDLAFLWASSCISDLALRRTGRPEKMEPDENLMGAALSLFHQRWSSPRGQPCLPRKGCSSPAPPCWLHSIPRKAADRQQEAGSGKEPGDSLPGKGGAAFHPWRQPLEECSSSKYRMVNCSQREGNTLKELQS